MQNSSFTSEGVTKIKELARTVLRKLRKLEYKNVPLIAGYENTEKEYTCLKKAVEGANSMIKELMCYEHGSRLMKALKNGIEVLSEKSTLRVYKNRDVFEELSLLARRVRMMNIDPESSREIEAISGAYGRISESKKGLNERLESIRLQLKEKRMHCVEIDKSRKNIKSMRYDLEILLQDGGYNGEIRDAEKKEFSAYSAQVLKKMLEFLEDSSIERILKSVAREHASHLQEASEVLRKLEKRKDSK